MLIHKKINGFGNKKGRLISIFYSALLIFVISIEALIVLLMFSSNREKISIETNSEFENKVFGPVLPVYILTDKTIINALDSGEDVKYLIQNKISQSLTEFQNVIVEEVYGVEPSYDFNDKKYTEIFKYENRLLKLSMIEK